jgi:hypothetical protein
MAQVTWRPPDELLERVRHAATSSGQSVNEWMTRVLDAATDPELSGSEVDRVRERLSRAGLLEEPSDRQVTRPDPALVAEASARAGRGTPLSQIISEQRE